MVKYKLTIHMNKSTFLIVLVVTSILFTACSKSDSVGDYDGNWVEQSDFEGVPRSGAVSFSIGDNGYIGTGYDGDNWLNDFWEYDVSRNTWIQKADLPGTARISAVAFAANQKGYVCTGYGDDIKLDDLWEFDPDLNTWVQKSDFPGSARYGAVGFAISNKGYIGSGYDGNYLKDFWEYDPLTDSWEQKVSIGGGKRRNAVGFTIDGKGYICTGIDNGNYETDFWEYDPLSDSWTEKNSIADVTDESFDNDYDNIIGIYKTAMVINGKAYLATGGTSTSVIVWEWDPSTDLWELKTEFEGVARTEAVAFTAAGRGFVATGRNATYFFDDIWELRPDEEYDEYD